MIAFFNIKTVWQYNFINKISCFTNKIYLFGSRASGTNQHRSDIDLAVDCSTEEEWLEVLSLIDDADTLLKIDCVRLNSLQKNDKLRQNIEQYGKIIYTKEFGFMDKKRWKDSFDALGKAISRLSEARQKAINLKEGDIEIYRDATIQRFEFTVELFWKILKKFLNYEQIEANTPREVLRESYAAKIIHQEDVWIKMMNDRNLTSHTYQEELAKEIFSRIGIFLPLLEETYKDLQVRYDKI